MPLTMPTDLAGELQEAARWYADSPEMLAFIEHVQAEHPWTERRPRQLLRWSDKHAIPVRSTRRILSVLLTGFDGPERWRFWRAAKAELRRARTAIERGEESGLIYAGDRELLTFGEGPRRWGPTESILRPSWHGSPIGPAPVIPTPETAPSAAPSSTPGSEGPRFPRGTIITRGRR